jgi:hypothetical protein
MVKVKSETEIKTNYESSTALVPARFAAGVKAATWHAEAIDGQALYIAQMSNPSVLARRETGIGKVSDDAWRTATVNKGQNIIGARMKDASDKQVANFRPYRAALESLVLPDKTADPMANLMNRGGAVVKAMVDTKAGQG